MKTLIKQEDMNALERELYDQNLFNTQPYQLQHPYERGMLISISNYKMMMYPLNKLIKPI